MNPDYIRQQYLAGQSPANIAKELGTYPNAVRRVLKRLGVPLRDSSEAQRLAIASGRTKHPTRGRPRTEAEKLAISQGMAIFWDIRDPEDRPVSSMANKTRWKRREPQAREKTLRAGRDAARKSATTGSKLERYLRAALVEAGHRVGEGPHLPLPDLNAVVVVDGPAHFKPFWGEKEFARVQASDAVRNSKYADEGLAVVCVCDRGLRDSNIRRRRVLTKLLEMLSLDLSVAPIHTVEVT